MTSSDEELPGCFVLFCVERALVVLTVKYRKKTR